MRVKSQAIFTRWNCMIRGWSSWFASSSACEAFVSRYLGSFPLSCVLRVMSALIWYWKRTYWIRCVLIYLACRVTLFSLSLMSDIIWCIAVSFIRVASCYALQFDGYALYELLSFDNIRDVSVQGYDGGTCLVPTGWAIGDPAAEQRCELKFRTRESTSYGEH